MSSVILSHDWQDGHCRWCHAPYQAVRDGLGPRLCLPADLPERLRAEAVAALTGEIDRGARALISLRGDQAVLERELKQMNEMIERLR